MGKKTKTKVILMSLIVGVLIFGLIVGIYFFAFYKLSKESDSGVGLKVHYYKDGVEIFPESVIQSVVSPPGIEIDQISFDIIAENTKNLKIRDIQIIDASPTPFRNTLPTTIQTLDIGETKLLWQSTDLIDVLQFEFYAQPVTFWIKISGKDEFLEEEIFVEHSVDLTFTKEYVSGGWRLDKLLDLAYSPESLKF